MFAIKLTICKLIFTSLILFEWNKFCKFPILVRSEPNFKSCGKRSSKWSGWSPDKNIFEWPWIASIGQFDNKENQIFPIWRHKCGATILNNNTLLTATFCIDDLPENNQIIVGNYDLNDTFTKHHQLLNINRTFFHPDFDNVTVYYDIAIIKTNEVIQFTDAVKPICLPYKPSADENFRKNLAVDIVGWSWEEEKIEEFNNLGKKRYISEYEEHDSDDIDYHNSGDSEETENDLFQSDLQHVHLKVFAKEKCNQYIDSVGIKMKSTLTCAGRDVRFFLPFYCSVVCQKISQRRPFSQRCIYINYIYRTCSIRNVNSIFQIF